MGGKHGIVMSSPIIADNTLLAAINTGAAENAFLVFHALTNNHILYRKAHRTVVRTGMTMLT
jgi:hypothetical protein